MRSAQRAVRSKMFLLALSDMKKLRWYWLVVAIVISGILHAQKIDTVFGKPVVRQHLALKYNVGAIGFFLGTEIGATYAPVQWLHVNCSYRLYAMILSGFSEGTPNRAEWNFFTELRVHFPFDYTYTGVFFAPFYGYGRLNLEYKERLGPYNQKYYDRFNVDRHILGGISGVSFCGKNHPRFVIELYAGVGQAIQRQIVRREPEISWQTDHTEMALRDSKNCYRFGFCLGYVFL